MRNLASIRKISNITPIDGKDRIVLAQIDGWQVIVQKADFHTGDLCVYCEIDSVLPEKPEFEFLRTKGFRIKTMKMAGVISQGICFPVSILPYGDYKEGQDVTDIIGIKQYESTMDVEKIPPSKNKIINFLMRYAWFRKIVLGSNNNDSFPSQISKTDEIRIQENPSILQDKQKYIFTEKTDGQSGSFLLIREKGVLKDKFKYVVCSRNRRLIKKDKSSYWYVSDRYNIEHVLRELIGNNDWVAIQGECIAPGVQKNKYKVIEPDLYVFNLIYPDGRKGSLEAKAIVEKYGMKFVPIVDSNATLPDTVEDMLALAHGKSLINPSILREGLVCRTPDGKHSFKAVDPLFLLHYDE